MKNSTIQKIFWRTFFFLVFTFMLAVIIAIASGCSAYRATSKPFIGYSAFNPIILINPATIGTNSTSALAQQERLRSESPSTPPVLSANAAPVIICAEQLYLSFYGGTAASNSVLSGIEIPLVGAP